MLLPLLGDATDEKRFQLLLQLSCALESTDNIQRALTVLQQAVSLAPLDHVALPLPTDTVDSPPLYWRNAKETSKLHVAAHIVRLLRASNADAKAVDAARRVAVEHAAAHSGRDDKYLTPLLLSRLKAEADADADDALLSDCWALLDDRARPFCYTALLCTMRVEERRNSVRRLFNDGVSFHRQGDALSPMLESMLLRCARFAPHRSLGLLGVALLMVIKVSTNRYRHVASHQVCSWNRLFPAALH